MKGIRFLLAVLVLSGCVSSFIETPPKKYSVTDEEIPTTYYGEIEGVYLGYQIAPHSVALKARESFYAYDKTGNESELERGLFLTEYLISNATPLNGAVVWPYPFEWPTYDLEPGWTGALSQAGCLKVMMLAYLNTGDKSYLEFGDKTLAAFDIDVADGGLLFIREGGYYWYPEYAGADPPFVLNGFITTLIWLHEYNQTMGDKKAGVLFDKGIESLIYFLPEYREGNWSYYDALGHVSNEHYHSLHVAQMKSLYELTGEEIFLEYYERWGP
jgi:hypothetical protein